MAKDKRRLEKTVAALQERFGAHSVRRPGEAPPGPDRLPTGFTRLDNALGGGLPRGRLTEVVGAPTSGVATLVLKIAAQAQAAGEMVVWLDLEQTFDPDYAARCGVVLEQLLLVRPRTHRAWTLLREFVAGDVALVVCDLFRFDPAAPALPAALEQLLAPLGKSATLLICLVSLPPGVAPASYAQKATLPSYAAVRLELQRERWLQRRQDICGYRARVLIAKNKVGRAGVSVAVDVAFGEDLQGDSA